MADFEIEKIEHRAKFVKECLEKYNGFCIRELIFDPNRKLDAVVLYDPTDLNRVITISYEGK